MPTTMDITITVRPVTGGYEIEHAESGRRAVAFTPKQSGRRAGDMIEAILAATNAPATEAEPATKPGAFSRGR